MNINYFLFILVFISCSGPKQIVKDGNEQSAFEGYVTYKMSTYKPDMISAEDWKLKLKEIAGEQGYFLFKNYYRPNQFAADINTGLTSGKQIYNPIDSLHYGWELGAETAITEDNFAPSMIKIKSMVDLDTTATINNIACKAIRVNMSIGYTIIWYNSTLLTINGDDYKGSLFSKEVIDKIKTLPVKADIPGMMVIDMIEHKKAVLNDSIFIIPEFKEIQRKPSY